MKASKGKANPARVNAKLLKRQKLKAKRSLGARLQC